jgi:hypothetical protein
MFLSKLENNFNQNSNRNSDGIYFSGNPNFVILFGCGKEITCPDMLLEKLSKICKFCYSQFWRLGFDLLCHQCPNP